MKKKIMCFDGWTLGSHHFEKLCRPLAKDDIDIFLLHLGSFGDEVDRPRSEKIGDLKVKDITYYGGLGFEAILKKEQPDLVIFLSTETFLHRAFNRYCKKLAIPTVYHFHGILSVIYMEYSSKGVDVSKHYNISFLSHFLFILKRLKKAIQYTVYIYLIALIKTRATFSDYMRFFSDIYRGLKGTFPKKSANDSITDYAFVFTPSDAKYAIQKGGIKKDKVFVIGNPDFDRFNIKDEMLGCMVNDNSFDKIIYIDTAFYVNGLHFSGVDPYVDYLMKIKLKLKQLNKKLIVYPHPATIDAGGHLTMKNRGIDICKFDELTPNLLKSKACICEPSSLFLVPAMLGITIILSKIDSFKNQLYSEFLLSYPKSFLLEDLNDLDKAFKDDFYDNLDTITWIDNNSGGRPLVDVGTSASSILNNILKN